MLRLGAHRAFRAIGLRIVGHHGGAAVQHWVLPALRPVCLALVAAFGGRVRAWLRLLFENGVARGRVEWSHAQQAGVCARCAHHIVQFRRASGQLALVLIGDGVDARVVESDATTDR